MTEKSTQLSVDHCVNEATYELGRVLALAWHANSLLTDVELDVFQRELARLANPVVGRLDDGSNDWLLEAV